MSKIRGKQTKPEILVRKFLYSKGFRYRINVPWLPGKPDIVLAKYRCVIFVNGCFWHGHPKCKYATLPKTNTDFWKDKIEKNAERDRNNYELLQDMGWNVIVVWQCELRNENLRKKRLEALVDQITRK